VSFFLPKICERNERFLLFCFPSFIYLIQNTRNTQNFTVVGFWGQRGGGGGRCHHLGRHRWSQSDGQKGSKVAHAYPQNRKGWRTLRDAKSPVTGWKRSSLVS
jgi:hypothetical protein